MLQDATKELREYLESIENPNRDGEVSDASVNITYLTIVVENIRDNNKAIRRNSFLLVLALSIYFLLLYNVIQELNASIFEISDRNIILNGIVIMFSYLYLVNIVRWYHNNDLRFKFDEISRKLFNLGILSNTSKVIKPFNILFHTLDYQSEKKDLNFWLRLPSLTAQAIVLFGPGILQLYFIYNLFTLNAVNFFSVIAAFLTVLLFLVTIIYAVKSR